MRALTKDKRSPDLVRYRYRAISEMRLQRKNFLLHLVRPGHLRLQYSGITNRAIIVIGKQNPAIIERNRIDRRIGVR